MGEIVVGVDGSEGSAQSLRWAAAEAERREATVTAVLAWGLLDQYHPDGTSSFDPDYDDDAAAAALAVMVERTLGADRAGTVGLRAVSDLPARALLDASSGADMIVVGARGMGGFKGMLLGSVSQNVLQHSKVPVAVVRGAGDKTGGRVVVGVDGSDASHRALEWAVGAAVVRSTELVAVSAWQPPVFGVFPESALALDPAEFEATAHELATDALGEVDTSALGGEPVVVTHLGGAAEGILATATDVDLIVVGSRGRGGFKGLLLGSVAMQVAQHSSSTVVVIPPPR